MSVNADDISAGRIALPWALCRALGVCLVAVTAWFLLSYPWVPFHPVCSTDFDHSEFKLQTFIIGPYRLLDGPLRREFRSLIMDREGFLDHRATRNDLFVPVGYYFFLGRYQKYTREMVSEIIKKELNPNYFDAYGRFDDTAIGELRKISAFKGIKKFEHFNCDIIRFYTIKGADTPKYIGDLISAKLSVVDRRKEEELLNRIIKQYKNRKGQ